ncbi:hypothetical protein, partial [Candidatus Pseudoscillospira sp. SGI.172]|uniref:hypothetical protein n=1 Tax=Candidatus Pseudoscillospira sp. SGI.172 TaxID=3420582 RepID=UPI003D01D172
LSRSAGFGEAPQQAFLLPSRAAKIASVATLALLAGLKYQLIFETTQRFYVILVMRGYIKQIPSLL